MLSFGSSFRNRYTNGNSSIVSLRAPATWLAMLIVLFSNAGQRIIFGDDNGKNSYRVVEVWVSEVIGRGGRVDLVLGEAPTYSKAVRISQKWSKAHPGDLRLTRERRAKKRVYPPFQNPPKPNAIASRRNNKKPGSNGASSSTASVQGRWSGKEGGSDVTFEFLPGGKVRAFDKYGSWSGTWRMLTATTVFVELTSPNSIRYSGQISSNTIKGTARNVENGKSWSFQLSRQAGVGAERLVGTKWTSLNEPGEGNTFYFASAAKLIWKNRRFGNTVVYSWRRIGDKIYTRYRDGPEHVSTIEGDSIVGWLRMNRKRDR